MPMFEIMIPLMCTLDLRRVLYVMNCELRKVEGSDIGFSENIITRRGTHFYETR